MYLVASDIHFHNWSAFSKDEGGVNSRLLILLQEMRRVLDEALATASNVYIAGDVFHVRGSLAPTVVNPVKDLFKEYIDMGVKVRIIPGNHDLESNEASQIANAVEILEPTGVQVVNKTTYFKDDNVLMVPWRSKTEALLKELETLDVDYHGADVIIHAPVNGVLVGVPDHGIWANQFLKFGFNRIFCGHYHQFKRMEDGNVYSIGALTHQTWSDIGTDAGFVRVGDGFDDVEHQSSLSPRFVDIVSPMSEKEVQEAAKNNYVRLRIGKATESQIKKARQELYDLGALGVVIEAVPDTKIVARTSSVKAGATIMESVNDWLKANPPKSAVTEVTKLCESFLEEADLEEV